MMKPVLTIIALLFSVLSFAQNDMVKVSLETSEGRIVIALYNETPLHRDNFLRKVKEGVYNGRTFNRVITGFVVQCGEEQAEDVIPAEIHYPQFFHRRGVVAMGRCTDDPKHELKSADEQFYISWGCPNDEGRMHRADFLMNAWSYGRCKMDDKVREYYGNNPGIPSLDGSYTIFGEVVDGMDIVEKIQSTDTDKNDRPLHDITINEAKILGGYWIKDAVDVDAYRILANVNPAMSCLNDSIYTIHDWYGVRGYDVSFVKTMICDSTAISVLNADSCKNGFYWMKTGLDDLPYATIYPGFFTESNTICSGFYGNEEKGKVWAYTYLYNKDRQWQGGHLYQYYWGEGPEKPIWTAKGKSTLVGNVPGLESTIDAYSGERYIIRNWYGAEKYDLEFLVKDDGSIEILDYYWTEEDGAREVQCRRDDIGISFASIPQGEKPNGRFKGDSRHGKVHFRMTAYEDDDKPIVDRKNKEFVFVW